MGLMDGVKRAMNERGMPVDQESMILHDRGEWR